MTSVMRFAPFLLRVFARDSFGSREGAKHAKDGPVIKSMLFPLAAIVLGGCDRGDAGNAAAAAPKSVARPAPAPAACAPAPTLVLSEDFADPHRAFALRTDPFRRTGVNFAAAYRAACAQGLLRGRTLADAGAGQPDRLFLRNAPEANIASIYLDGEEGAPAPARRMVLEYPFLTADGTAHVPGTEELAEAIFCHVRGASVREAEESGRCLPD
jgi:hypothetical protein